MVGWRCRTGGGWGLDGAPFGGSSTCIDSPNWVNEVFLDIYVSCRCQKISHLQNLDKI
jgi:hypothetical protein